MIDDNTYKYKPGVTHYLNGYPAFMTVGAATIDQAFYNRYMKHLVYYVDPRYASLTTEGERIVKEWIDSSGFTTEEFSDYVKPVIQMVWARGNSLYHGKVTMEMAQAFLMFIEPYWCNFKNIRSTGYVDNLLRQASCLIDDDDEIFDI